LVTYFKRTDLEVPGGLQTSWDQDSEQFNEKRIQLMPHDAESSLSVVNWGMVKVFLCLTKHHAMTTYLLLN